MEDKKIVSVQNKKLITKVEAYKELLKRKAEIELQLKQYEETFIELIKSKDADIIMCDGNRLLRVEGSCKTTFNSKLFSEEHPEIKKLAEKYYKTGAKGKDSLRIS